MNASTDLILLKRCSLLALVLILVALFTGEPAQAAPLQASTVSITMNNPACVQALPLSGTCAIEVNSLTAAGSDPTFSRIELLINGRLRLFMNGFFETTAYFNYRMVPGGLKVACGRPNDGGLPGYGKSYSVVANAYMADGTTSSASTTVYCPAYDGKTFLPSVRK